MEDYEEELHGVEDDFHSQFAAELEVLAELEGGCSPGRALGCEDFNAAARALLLFRASPMSRFLCRGAIPAVLQALAASHGRGLPNVRGGHCWRGRRHSVLPPWFSRQHSRCQKAASGCRFPQ